MSTVVMNNVVSLDGFVADLDDDPGPLFDWYFNGDRRLDTQDMADPAPGGLQVSQASYDYVRPVWDQSAPWSSVATCSTSPTGGRAGRRPATTSSSCRTGRRPAGWHPEAPYHFVDDVTAAVALARELAGDRTVSVSAGDVGGQALALGLVDEVAMDVAPVVLGSGKRYFGPVDSQHLLEDPHVVVQGDRVLHLRFRVRGS